MFLSSFQLLSIEQQAVAITLQKFSKSLARFIFKCNASPFFVNVKTEAKHLQALSFIAKGTFLLRTSTLSDIVVTDCLRTKGRFSVIYIFFSALCNLRLQIGFSLNETGSIPSLSSNKHSSSSLFSSSAWLEREVWDLFGIYFTDHHDLRRILTDYGFSGHPLRKDFPLTGFYELLYSDSEGRLISTPIELTQEFRVFHL